jgi:hypothetical protein
MKRRAFIAALGGAAMAECPRAQQRLMIVALIKKDKRKRLREILRALDYGVFAVLIALLAWKALTDVDIEWDSVAYHLPFAALTVGIFTHEQYSFGFGSGLEATYAGFPHLHDLLRGILWVLTSNPNTCNLLNVAVFGTFTLLLHYFSRVPATLIAIATAAIPVVHLQLAGAHADNLCNLPFGLALLLVIVALVGTKRSVILLYAAIVGSLAFAANVKLQFVPLAAFALVLSSVYFFLNYVRRAASAEKRIFVSLFVVAGAAIAWLPIKSFAIYGNPIYPVSLSLFGLKLPGWITTEFYSGPEYLQGSSAAWRWLVSVSEFRAFDFRWRPYAIAQGDVPVGAMSFRMGGYLFNFVVITLGTLILALKQLDRRSRIMIAAILIGMTFAVMNIPGSHELRYYSFWMVTLVSTTLALLWTGSQPILRATYGVACIGSFLFVASITGYTYLFPQERSLKWLLASQRADQFVLEHIHAGGRYCVNPNKYAFLLAPYFHPNQGGYSIKAFVSREQCPPGWEYLDFNERGNT